MSLDAIARDLMSATASDRVTIRLDEPGNGYLPVLYEALGPEVDSLKGPGLVTKTSGVVNLIRDERRILVQRDVLVDEPLALSAWENYRVRAQLLGPLFSGDDFVGFVSVHALEVPRDWTNDDIAALGHALER